MRHFLSLLFRYYAQNTKKSHIFSFGGFSFATFIKKNNGPRAKWTIHKHELDKNKKLLSVGNFRILSANFSEFWKKINRIPFIILVYANLARFLKF